jgi:cytochrome c-type biogenesis protein CcmH/NrfF
MKPNRIIALVAAFILGPALLATIHFRFASSGARPSLQEVTEGLTCQCGCGLTVANCNHPDCSFSIPIKKDISAMLVRGMSTSEILASYRAKYGEKILSAPTTEGFNLLAWITPFAALIGGALAVVAAVSRWNRRGHPQPPAPISAAEPAIDPRLRARLEVDLRKER